MTTILHNMPSAHSVKVLEIRCETSNIGGPYYCIYVDDQRLASIFGLNNELPALVLPEGDTVRIVG
jgi:hypothetical protein